jgi:hypothetical protein
MDAVFKSVSLVTDVAVVSELLPVFTLEFRLSWIGFYIKSNTTICVNNKMNFYLSIEVIANGLYH